MEAIAKSADVSIMTLYRHAPSKDDLFAAVTSSACAPTSQDERALAATLTKPLPQALLEAGMQLQAIVTAEDNVALLRVVLAEAARFPNLARLTYDAFVVRLEDKTAWMLSELEQTATLPNAKRNRLGRLFVEAIVGPDLLRVLLGLPGPTNSDRLQRAARARDGNLRELGSASQLVGATGVVRQRPRTTTQLAGGARRRT